ncbi:NAD(P)-dependent oxidoreductase [Microbacterium album]|uniref:Oxidoreductase n=1 Tax=Microbacterium album TaxID=2053191 RepID=A0A917IFI0_9MICO|nr:NAD(P)-dependent oxidoreductase [Microbacterium album]GGH44781.1 oxidoreductase [Microbacterium album]
METVGFVGLGTMGDPMSSNIAAAGYDLRLYDAAPGRAAELAARIGATAVDEPEGLAECGVVVLMLPTSAIVRSVLLTDEGGLRIPFAPGTVVVDMSSSDPNETVETGKALAAHGVAMVDAPVSGAKERAAAGTLAIMLGADDDAAAERAIPVIDTMSHSIYRTGRLGTGHAMKALNNYVAGAAFVAASEALVAGERFGLDPKLMVDVFNDSTGQSFTTTHVLGPHVVERRFASGFALALLTKDVRIARDLERSVEHEAPVCEAVTDSLQRALDELGPVDHTQAYEYWEKR